MSKILMPALFPTEILHYIFEYLSTDDILSAFDGLDRRIDAILHNYDRYDFICQSISPEQIRSLILSDDEDTVRQINLFFRSFYIRRLINLKSLTLNEIGKQEWNKFASKLHYLPNLTSLSLISSCPLSYPPSDVKLSLKSLTFCQCTMDELHQWLLCTPMLINLDVKLYNALSKMASPIATNIHRLKIEFPWMYKKKFEDLEVLFTYMPKLEILTCIMINEYDLTCGIEWKDLIEECLPQLKDFRFKYQTNADEYVIRLWKTYQIPFWLDEHQSVIHYNFHMLKIPKDWYNLNAHLYTLPYCDEEFHLATTTTCFTNASKDEYQSIKHLNLHVNSKYYSHLLEYFYFPNLDSLTIPSTYISIPFIEFINLSQLKHLTIESDSIISKQLLSQIFVHTINLQSLKLSWRLLTELTQHFSNQQICAILQKQIKSLHLYKRCTFKNEKDDQNPIEKLIEIFSENLEKINIEFVNSLCIS